jgi:hypothetical protein
MRFDTLPEDRYANRTSPQWIEFYWRPNRGHKYSRSTVAHPNIRAKPYCHDHFYHFTLDIGQQW